MKTTIRAILTDFDGVLRHFPKERDAAIEKEFQLEPGALGRAAFLPRLLQPVVTGQVSDEQWRLSIADAISEKIDHQTASKAVAKWSDFPGLIDREVFNLVLSFKQRVPVALLTNATTRLNSDLVALGLRDSFSRIFNSSEMGCCKPDSRIFELAVQKLGCDPTEVLFIDDSRSHIEGAKSVGLVTHHFEGISELKNFLRDETGGLSERAN